MKHSISNSLSAIAFTGIMLLCSCQKQSLEQEMLLSEIPIEMGVTLSEEPQVKTRSRLDDFAGTDIAILAGTSSGNYTALWDAKVHRTDVGVGKVQFIPKRFYPLESPIFLKVIYPKPDIVDMGANTYTYDTSKGDKDIVVSEKEVWGTFSQPIVENLKFERLMTNFVIDIQNNGSFPEVLKLVKIRITGFQVTATLNSEKNDLLFSGPTDQVMTVLDNPAGITPTSLNTITVATFLTQPGVNSFKATFNFKDEFGNELEKEIPVTLKTPAGDITYVPKKGESYKVKFILASFAVVPEVSISTIKLGTTPPISGSGSFPGGVW